MGIGEQILNTEAEVMSQLSLDPSNTRSNPVPARWGTGSCQADVAGPSSSSAPMSSTALARKRVARDTEFHAELMGNPMALHRAVKTQLDGDLGDFCDWIRKH